MTFRELPFSIPVSGVIRIKGDSVTITVNRAETNISLEMAVEQSRRTALEKGMTMYDVILESAQKVVKHKGFNRFSAPDLYRAAKEKYPSLNRASFITRVIACAPNHPSYKHHKSGKDYLSYISPGLYWLNKQYMEDRTLNNERTLSRAWDG